MNSRARIDADRDVQAIARGLGITRRTGLGEAIRDVTVARVEDMLGKLNVEPRSIFELREVVHHVAGLRVVRIDSDEDLETAQKDYGPELRGLPKQLAFEFAQDTEALVVRRPPRDSLSNSKFIAGRHAGARPVSRPSMPRV